jgi:regulator of replication initiation timing
MAARENQGYLIAVIVLILLLLVATLVAFLGWNSYFDMRDAKVNAEKKGGIDAARAEAFDYLYKVQAAYIGKLGQSTAEVETMLNAVRLIPNKVDSSGKEQVNQIVKLAEDLKTQYDSDMKLMIATGTAEQQQEMTWRGLVENYAAALGKIHDNNNIMEEEVRRITQETKAALDKKEEEVKATQQELETVKTELDSKSQEFAANETRLNSENEKLKGDVKTVSDRLETKKRESEKEKTELTLAANEAIKQRDNAQAQLDRIYKESFDIADGRIVRVSPELGSVILNIGSEDGLRPNQTFSIYDQMTKDFDVEKSKASIEVTAVTGPHQSEARITKENSLNPILTNDQILSPSWDPGYRVPIAVAGIFDLDFDGSDDRERLIQDIERNGGRVVAFHDKDGKVFGQIDSATRYFVLGDSPSSDGPDSKPEIGKAISELTKQARGNSVQEIDIRKLLNWMGRHGKAPIERMDAEMGERERRESRMKNDSR